MFLGTYYYNVDEKNRLNLPSKIAEKFNNFLIINKGLDGCLELTTKENFEQKVSKLLQLSQNKKNSRIIIRQFLANSNEIEIDKNNRILIPASLKKEANLKKEVVLIGLGDKFELWDKVLYEKFKVETDSCFEEIAERLDDGK